MSTFIQLAQHNHGPQEFVTDSSSVLPSWEGWSERVFGAVAQRALAASASMSSVTVDRVALREDLLCVPVRLLREARDNILLATPDSYVPVVQFRMERFIKATAERLDALLEYRPLLSRTAEDLLVSRDVAREAIDSLEDAVQLWKFLKLKREPEGDALREELRHVSEAIASFNRGIIVRLENPVRVADAAKVAGIRADVLLGKLRNSKYPIAGEARSYTAGLEHILLCVAPAKRKQLKKWAGLLDDHG